MVTAYFVWHGNWNRTVVIMSPKSALVSIVVARALRDRRSDLARLWDASGSPFRIAK